MQKLLDKLERWIRPFAVPNLTVVLIAGQVLLYLLAASGRPDFLDLASLEMAMVFKGDVWRLFSFLFVVSIRAPIWMFFYCYLFYFMGSALEHHWGTARYNLFLFLGAVATVLVAFLLPDASFSGVFLQGTVFLAFATIFPEFVLQIFFVLPVKVKWLGWLQGVGYLLMFVAGPNAVRLMILASIANYLLFFAPSLYHRIRYGVRKKRFEAKVRVDSNKPRHACTTCGITNLTHPTMDFRYCTKCAGQCGYCEQHIRDHQHVTDESAR